MILEFGAFNGQLIRRPLMAPNFRIIQACLDNSFRFVMYNASTIKANNTDKLCQKGCNGNNKTNQQHNLIIDILIGIGIGILIAFARIKLA